MKTLLITFLSLFLITSANAQEAIGKIMNIAGSAYVERKNTKIDLKVSDHVYLRDVVHVSEKGTLGLVFLDGTAFSLENGARFELNEFVFNSKNKSMFFSITAGAMSMISGAIAPTGNMKIDTPVGTMGIRGTAPRVVIKIGRAHV